MDGERRRWLKAKQKSAADERIQRVVEHNALSLLTRKVRKLNHASGEDQVGIGDRRVISSDKLNESRVNRSPLSQAINFPDQGA